MHIHISVFVFFSWSLKTLDIFKLLMVVREWSSERELFLSLYRIPSVMFFNSTRSPGGIILVKNLKTKCTKYSYWKHIYIVQCMCIVSCWISVLKYSYVMILKSTYCGEYQQTNLFDEKTSVDFVKAVFRVHVIDKKSGISVIWHEA